jgi:hypothetical protein
MELDELRVTQPTSGFHGKAERVAGVLVAT